MEKVKVGETNQTQTLNRKTSVLKCVPGKGNKGMTPKRT